MDGKNINNLPPGKNEQTSDADLTRAKELINSLLQYDLPQESIMEVQAWFRSAASSDVKYVALEDVFKSLQPNMNPGEHEYKQFAKIKKLLEFPSDEPTRGFVKRPLKLSRIMIRIAAVVIPAAMIIWGAFLWVERVDMVKNITDSPMASVVSVSTDSAKHIILSDGSQVTLSTYSELKYDESFIEDRCVTLSGEALFAVEKSYDEHGALRPFTVVTDNITVNVHGTVFQIVDHRNDIESEVSLYEGSVSVSVGAAATRLECGEKLSYNCTTQKIRINLISAEEMIEHGFKPQLRFEMSNLSNIITALKANYEIEFVLPDDADLSKGSYSGDFRQESLESTLAILTKSIMTYSFTLRGDKIIVTRK